MKYINTYIFVSVKFTYLQTAKVKFSDTMHCKKVIMNYIRSSIHTYIIYIAIAQYVSSYLIVKITRKLNGTHKTLIRI